MDYKYIGQSDPDALEIIRREEQRQKEGLEMIPSENYTSGAVMAASGSVLTNKYSEGYAGKRYYGGNQYIDEVERLAIKRAKELFGVPHVNVQPYSGSPANFAVYMATCDPGDTIMGLNLPDGGHLTHGWKVSATAIFYESVPYHVKEDGRIDMEEVESLAVEHSPKLIWVGATAYPYQFDFEEFARIADKVGAYLAADMAHVIGLVVAGAHLSPVEYAHIITTTTHKTLRGPRGGMIMVTKKGIAKDADLPSKIDKAVFPGLQGGPHDHTTAAIAVALGEAAKPEFKIYGKQIVKNAQALANSLKAEGIKLVGDGTENHLLLIDLTSFGPGRGVFIEKALDAVHITVNKNTIPKDPSSPFYPSGIRLGTPALTSRGMKEKEMEQIGKWIAHVVKEFGNTKLPDDKKQRARVVKDFKKSLKENSVVKELGEQVIGLASKFPVPGIE